MATTTPNFGWSVPTSSDLVKNGAVAIETLGDSIDASLVDLKGGTTGQVLAKATNTDMDFTWTTPSSGGKVAQVLSTTKTDTFTASLASGANTAITGLSQAITPSLSSSKILVTVSVTGNMANRNGFAATLARGATLIGLGDASSSRTRIGAASATAEDAMTGNLILQFLDSPSTTSSVTYNVYAQNINVDTRTVYVNRPITDTDAVNIFRAASTITVMEILA